MIRVTKGDKKLRHSLEEYSKVIDKAREDCNDALKHFFKLIGLDPSWFSHLYKTPIVINLDTFYDIEDQVAFYDAINESEPEFANTINLLPEFLDTILREIERYGFNDNLVNTLLHENIHANRSIIINDAVIYPNCELFPSKEYEEFYNMFQGVSIDTKKRYKVLKYSKSNKYKDYTIYAYDTKNGDYVVFRLPARYNLNINNINEMERVLNRSDFIFVEEKRVSNPYSANPTIIASFNSMIFKHPETLEEDDMGKVCGEINKQHLFEESLTEGFARIILYLKDKDEFDFDELIKFYECRPYIYLALNFIKDLDMDTIRWFFLSCYDE